IINNIHCPDLQQLHPTGDASAVVIRNVFEDAYNYMKSGQLIRQVINKIQEGIDYNNSKERHAFGDMYEQILRDLQSAGNAGEFYTMSSSSCADKCHLGSFQISVTSLAA